LIPNVIDDVTTTKVDDQVMQLVFPGEEPLKLSASALTTFYNNQYLYFLRYVLGLEELESIHPDARHHGTYLHRVFERVMGDSSSENFDDKLEKAIAQTNQEQPFEILYTEDQESRLSRQILEDIARSTASVLRDNVAVKVEREEAKFDLLLANSIKITGIIDRVDRLTDGALGVVDYKSGKNVFDIQKFYNGLSPQLVTYLEALRQTYKVDADQLFGAMYLHMQDPQLNLAQFGLDKLAAQAHKELTYKGLFVASETEHLAGGNYDLQKAVTYDKEDLETLLDYNIKLFTDAAEIIRSGNFAVNPYTEDGKSVQGDQIKAITHFEADRHMRQARKLLRLPSKGKKEAYLELMTKDEDNNQMQVAENIITFPDKERKLTPEQIEAIYSNGSNILVSASAGSGKTFVMVERILDMIGRGVGIDQLFISTFTVKAAGELKERLEKRLTEQLGQVETDEERVFLSDQIAKIGTADIGTMDAFTQKLVNQYGYLLGVSPIFRIMTDPAEQTLMKNEVYVDLFNDYMQGKDAQLFQKLVRNFAGNGKTSKAFRDLVYDVYNFSQATAGPEKWLRQNLLKGQTDAKPDKAKVELLEGLKDGLLADFLAFLRDHLGLAQREFAKAKYLNNVSDAISLLEGALANDQTDMEDLLKQLLTLSQI